MENTAEDDSKKRLQKCYKKRDSKDEEKFYARTAALFRKTIPTYSRRCDNSKIGYEHMLPQKQTEKILKSGTVIMPRYLPMLRSYNNDIISLDQEEPTPEV
jgi:hypothetical protein